MIWSLLALLDHLTDGERPAEDADVGVDAGDDDVADAALLHQVEGFGAVGDGVTVADLDGVDLS
jgi:hypothetical protein